MGILLTGEKKRRILKLVNIAQIDKTIYLFCRENKELKIYTDNSFFPFYYRIDPTGKYIAYDNQKLKKVFVCNTKDIPKTSNIYSSDISLLRNYLTYKVDKIEKTELKYFFIDIEVLCKEFPKPEEAKHKISCITIYNTLYNTSKTWFLADFSEEKAMLDDFIAYIKKESPDAILGWNIDNFDLPYLCGRYKGFSNKISPIDYTRHGQNKNILYPAGISIIDYMQLFKKVYMREASYALDYIMEKYLGKGKEFKNVDFSILSEEIKKRNVGDVLGMLELEKKFKLLDYYDEIRRYCKVQYEDLYYNSRIAESLILQEAKEKNVVLPNKIINIKEKSFEGAIRDSKEGIFKGVGHVDLTSAYPGMITNFCLDSQNINDTEGIEIEGIKFKQNPEALLPSAVRKILILKNNLKEEKKNNKELDIKYDAIKGICNSLFGAFGNEYFRMFDLQIVSTITFLVRDLLNYCKEELEKSGYNVMYFDTDSVFYNSPDNLSEKLNNCIQEWGKKYGKENIDLKFEYEGYYKSLVILGTCHYHAIKDNDEIEMKGIEAKRSSSSKYEGWFQGELLMKIHQDKTQEEIVNWINQEKERIKTLNPLEFSFPAKIKAKKYKVDTMILKSYKNTQRIRNNFVLQNEELFYYIFVKGMGDAETVVFKEDFDKIFDRKYLDWDNIIRRNILKKAENIFIALGWDDCIDLIKDNNQEKLF